MNSQLVFASLLQQLFYDIVDQIRYFEVVSSQFRSAVEQLNQAYLNISIGPQRLNK